MSHTEDIIHKKIQPVLDGMDGDLSLVMFINGTIENDVDFYAFIYLIPSKMMDFKRAIENKSPINLTDFGEVIKAGEGLIPPDDVKKEMEENYNVDYEFSAKVIDMMAGLPNT